jgi:hypothetical protein
MMKKLLILGAATVMSIGSAASAATYSASFSGDVCSIPPGADGPFVDCSLIEQAGNPTGVFTLALTGLNPNIAGDAKITVSAQFADLFLNDEQIAQELASLPQGTTPRTNIRNNLDESFVLSLDSLLIGRLFDGLPENSIFQGLSASVQASIDNATGSVGSFLLEFLVAKSQIEPLLADGEIFTTFDFRAPNAIYNVNFFSDPAVTLEYQVGNPQVVPLPASGLLLIAGVLSLALSKRRRG